jgi:hypothetical protein
MRQRASLPLLEQMVEWFAVENVVYCVAFLANVWLDDDALPLKAWHQICEGNVTGVNLNKCVRNILRILKYRLFVSQTQARAALLSLEYTEETRHNSTASQARAKLVGEMVERVRQEKRPTVKAKAARRPSETPTTVSSTTASLASATESSSATTSTTTPEEPRFAPREREAVRMAAASRARRNID